MGTMTRDDAAERLRELAAEVERAITPALRRAWAQHLALQPALVGRQAILSQDGRTFAYQLSYRTPSLHEIHSDGWNSHQHEHATAHVLQATFGRADLETVADGRPLFVRFPRAYLVGDLGVPPWPDRLVIEVEATQPVDDRLVTGLRSLRERGYRIAVPGFVDSGSQRRLLPHSDFVKIDVRDLDVEGYPVVGLARSFGARLVAEYVESPEALAEARALGFTLFQGNLLARPGVLDRASARPVKAFD